MTASKADRKLKKRNSIIDAAVKIFAQKGFYNAKVTDVAKLAGVADGTIYLYFKSKDDLLINLFEEKMELFLRRFHTCLDDIADPLDKLKEMIDVYFELIEEDKDLADVFQVELRQSTKFLKDYHNAKYLQYLNMIADIVSHGVEYGFFRPEVNVHVIKIMIFGALDELARQWILGADDKYSLDEAKENLKQVLISGLLKF